MADFAEDLRFRGLIHQVTDPGARGAPGRRAASPPTAASTRPPTACTSGTCCRSAPSGASSWPATGPSPWPAAAPGSSGIPGGKSEERSLLTEEELAGQPGGHPRASWSASSTSTGTADGPGPSWSTTPTGSRPMSLFDFLRDVGKHFTVNQMVAKDSVRSRLSRADQGISYTEFSYMLLQAYDFLHLFDDFGCRLQIGGSDQWGNITMGIELIRKVRQAEAWGLTTPLVLKADGTKFGKTESGTVWLDAARTSPYQLYQFFLRSEDAVVGTYLRYFTFLSHEEILALDEATADASRAARGPAGAGPSGVHAGPRRGRDRPGRAGRRRPVRRGARRARRAHAARRVRRRPVHRPGPHPPRRTTAPAGRPAGRDGPGPVEEPGPHHGRARAAPTSTTAGRTTSPGA